jgi:hypothetical protein
MGFLYSIKIPSLTKEKLKKIHSPNQILRILGSKLLIWFCNA